MSDPLKETPACELDRDNRFYREKPASEPMHWEDATKAEIDTSAYYVIQHNGGEWRDFDLGVVSGHLVKLRLEPGYVRGRPIWIAKITPRPLTAAQ